MKKLAASMVLAVHVMVAHAQDNGAEGDTARVEVATPRDPELRSYAQMLKGQKAYKEKHELAPDSVLFFILIPKSNRIKVADVTMRLASDEESISIPIDADGKFALPTIEGGNDEQYDLILNRPKGQFLIRPYVKSAGLPDDVKRLGDLRLECEVRWAIEKQDVSFVFRAYVSMSSGNPCTAKIVAVKFYAPEGVESITMDTPGAKFAFKVKPFDTYSFPLWDRKLSDDGLIRYARGTAPGARQEN